MDRIPRQFAADELLFCGRIVSLHKVQLRMDDGELIDRELLRYPGAAVVLPVLGDGSIVLIRQYRFAVGQTIYELPAGTLEKGEDPAVCAARELTEETGYTASSIVRLGGCYSAPGSSDEYIHSFLATGLTVGNQALERHEEIGVEVVLDAQARRMVLDGTIRDAKTVATLALYWLGRSVGPGPAGV